MWFRQQTASWRDFEALTRRMASDQDALRRQFWRKLKRVAADLPYLEDLLAVHYCAFDRRTPLQAKAVLVGAIAYFILPTDWMPQHIPVIGYIDDAAVLAAAVKIVSSHITPDHREAARRTLARLRGEQPSWA